MKVRMAEWVGGIQNLPTWWKHTGEIDVTPEQLQELFDTGNNYMLYHGVNDIIVLYVDNKRFGMR